MEDYLPSGVPFPLNVLEPLGTDGGPEGRVLHLPASRLSRSGSSSSQATHSEVLPLKVVSRRAFRAIPAVSSRMRYHRANDATSRSTIMASLELDIPVFAQHPVELTNVSVKFATGEVQPMLGGQALNLPTICQARDSVACLYALTRPSAPPVSPTGQSSTMVSIDINVDARVLASDDCKPCIKIRWKQNIDFATALNQKFNRVRSSIHRNNRPRSLSTNTNGHAPAPSSDSARQFVSDDMGLSVTITGEEDIFVGEPFKWDVFIINRSNKSRKFILTLLPKRHIADGKRGSSRPTSSQVLPAARGSVLADAVIDDNVLYTIIRSQGSKNTPLVSLSSDLRTRYVAAPSKCTCTETISSLAPGSCFNAELELLPLAKGSQHVESLRVRDADTNEAVDIHDLPDIMVTERPENK